MIHNFPLISQMRYNQNVAAEALLCSFTTDNGRNDISNTSPNSCTKNLLSRGNSQFKVFHVEVKSKA